MKPEFHDILNSSSISVQNCKAQRHDQRAVKKKARREASSVRERGRTADWIFWSQSRSGAFLLLFFSSATPANSRPSHLYYVVIGLFFEPCDALLQIKLRFSPLPSSLSNPPELSIARAELPRNQFCSVRRIPLSVRPSPTSTPRILSLPSINTRFFKPG